MSWMNLSIRLTLPWRAEGQLGIVQELEAAQTPPDLHIIETAEHR